MRQEAPEVIVAGHICLDIIPALSECKGGLDSLFIPGQLVNVGPAVVATGGAVSNTGIALYKLGHRVKLMGKLGDDPFGETIIRVLSGHHPSLAEGMIVAPGEHSSYTVVISPPHVDRIFLHSPGANDTYTAQDLKEEPLRGAKLFHFGYPPLMQGMFAEQGRQLTELLRKVKLGGLTVTLDMAKPDPDSAAGKADWLQILNNSLAFTDVFMPSFEEILYMLKIDQYRKWLKEAPGGDLLAYADSRILGELSAELLSMGTAVVAIKLGEHGLYVRTSSDPERLSSMGACKLMTEGWLDRELLATCFEVDVIGTTGAGDCTIAGFLSGMLQGLKLESCVQMAVGVGACNVEQADASSGIQPLHAVRQRMASGWRKRELTIPLNGWEEREQGLWEAKRG